MDRLGTRDEALLSRVGALGTRGEGEGEGEDEAKAGGETTRGRRDGGRGERAGFEGAADTQGESAGEERGVGANVSAGDS